MPISPTQIRSFLLRMVRRSLLEDQVGSACSNYVVTNVIFGRTKRWATVKVSQKQCVFGAIYIISRAYYSAKHIQRVVFVLERGHSSLVDCSLFATTYFYCLSRKVFSNSIHHSESLPSLPIFESTLLHAQRYAKPPAFTQSRQHRRVA